jgi:4-hydroxy-tetrahydrodipicolinate synthase
LLLGTTGEGPSFSPPQRQIILESAIHVREVHPQFRLLAGTGTPSLDETIYLTKIAFDLGYDGVVVLPPYYYRKAGDEGLFTWFSLILKKAVPQDGCLLGYHIPAVSGVFLSLDLLERLKAHFPQSFAGLKDSSGDPDFARALAQCFGDDLAVLTGHDSLFSHALSLGVAGCITAPANLFSPLLRHIWDQHLDQNTDLEAQDRIDIIRKTLDSHPPYPPLIKALLNRLHGFPLWPVCPPLRPQSAEGINQVVNALNLA